MCASSINETSPLNGALPLIALSAASRSATMRGISERVLQIDRPPTLLGGTSRVTRNSTRWIRLDRSEFAKKAPGLPRVGSPSACPDGDDHECGAPLSPEQAGVPLIEEKTELSIPLLGRTIDPVEQVV